MENSIEEDITKINTYIELVLEKDYCNCNELNTILGKHCDGSKNVAYAMQHILSDYKRALKDNERYKKSDYETICLENNELREITDRIQSEYNDLLKDNFKLKNELETKRKEYQETYKDVREELKELKKENEELNNRCRNLDKEAQAYLEELAGDNTLTKRTIKQLQEENEELKNKYATFIKMSSEVPQNCIPTSLVKEKIEEYKACGIEEGDYHIFQEEINALQDLLERGEGR